MRFYDVGDANLTGDTGGCYSICLKAISELLAPKHRFSMLKPVQYMVENTEHFFTPPRDTGSGCDQGDILPDSQSGLAFYKTRRNDLP